MTSRALIKSLPRPQKPAEKGIQLGKPMPGLLEREILESVKHMLTWHGYKVLRLATQGKLAHTRDGKSVLTPSDMKGYPDLVVFHKGITYWLEVKRPGGVIKEKQMEALRTLAKYDIRCGIVFDADTALKCMKESIPGVIWLPAWLPRPKELA